VALHSATDDSCVTSVDWATIPLAPENGCHGGIVHFQGNRSRRFGYRCRTS